MRAVVLRILFLINILNVSQLAVGQDFHPGQLWLDDSGKHINAHGGGILSYDGRYYWFGENKSHNTTAALVGISCYSSTDLVNWKNEGVVLPVSDSIGSDIEKGCVMERPKVIYNRMTGKFVMWFHLELRGKGYSAARAAVAVSDKVTGPYTLLSSGRVNACKYPLNMTPTERDEMERLDPGEYKEWWTPSWREAISRGLFLKRDFRGGQMSRDMTLFVDGDKAYHVYSSEDNLTIHIAELTDDYTAHTGRYVRVAAGGQNEAPALFKHDGVYWMITSGCTGWAPNEARMFSSNSIWGPWQQHPSPCRGEKASTTFGGQGTFVLYLPQNDLYIFMADEWRPQQPDDSRYIWLPIDFEEDKPVIKWRDSWNYDRHFVR